jgi:hypothetical protein
VPDQDDKNSTKPFTDYEARKAVALSLLESCKMERYVYLAFTGLAGFGVLVSAGFIFTRTVPTLAQLGMLTSSGGTVALTASRILKIQHDMFQVVFGVKL